MIVTINGQKIQANKILESQLSLQKLVETMDQLANTMEAPEAKQFFRRHADIFRSMSKTFESQNTPHDPAARVQRKPEI